MQYPYYTQGSSGCLAEKCRMTRFRPIAPFDFVAPLGALTSMCGIDRILIAQQYARTFLEVMMCFLVLSQGGSIDVSLGWSGGLGGELWAVSLLNVVEKKGGSERP